MISCRDLGELYTYLKLSGRIYTDCEAERQIIENVIEEIFRMEYGGKDASAALQELKYPGQAGKRRKNGPEAREQIWAMSAQGHTIEEISRLTGHVPLSIRNYLKETCSPVTALYDHRLSGKLAAYEHEVIRMRAEGITNAKIHEAICQKGYDGSVASLRIFMQKERTRRKTAAD